MLPEITAFDFAAALEAQVAEILDQAGIVRPPVDALAIAERLRMTVAWDERQSGRARLVRLRGGSGPASSTILLRPEPRRERRQWAVAHEIGEDQAHAVFARLGVDPREAPPGAREDVANQLAGRLLLPTAWFRRAGLAVDWDLLALKRRFATASHEMIARRMLEFPFPAMITVVDDRAVTFRRGNVPGVLPPWSQAERQCQQRARVLGKPATRRDGSRLIRAWPIHEPGWQREIVRVDLEDVECDE